MSKKAMIFGVTIVLASFWVMTGGPVPASADCRPPLTLTATDYQRMTEATDEFIEGNYIQANVAWEIAGEPRIGITEVVTRIYVGPQSVLNVPGGVIHKKSKLYDIVLTRKCANEGWTMESFKAA